MMLEQCKLSQTCGSGFNPKAELVKSVDLQFKFIYDSRNQIKINSGGLLAIIAIGLNSSQILLIERIYAEKY